MRLIVIVDTYVPARISAALQMRDLVCEMRAQGHDPVVVVPAYDLNGTAWRVDEIDGSPVLRVSAPRSKGVGNIRRALAEWWLPYALMRGLRHSPFAATRWDGVIWYSPTIFLGPMVRSLKKRWDCRSYLILRDLFPDWAVDAGLLRKGMIYQFFKRVERAQYAIADVIGVQTPANVPIVQRDAPLGTNIEVLNNWLAAPTVAPCSVDLSQGPLAGRTIFAYTGNIGIAQGMDILIDLAIALHERTDIGFLFVGRGTEMPRLQARVSSADLTNVQFVEELDSAEIPGLLAQCHVGLIALDPRHTTHNIPGKLLMYLHAGLPVLARINPGNDLKSLVDEKGIGAVTISEDKNLLVRHALALADMPQERALMGYRGQFIMTDIFSPKMAVCQIIACLRK